MEDVLFLLLFFSSIHRLSVIQCYSVPLCYVMTGLIAACLSALLTELIALSKMAILLNNKLL